MKYTKWLVITAALLILSVLVVSSVDAHRRYDDDCEEYLCTVYLTPTPIPTVSPTEKPEPTIAPTVTPEPVNLAKDPPEKSDPCYYSGVCVSKDPGKYPNSNYDNSLVGWK